jgi:putative transposase
VSKRKAPSIAEELLDELLGGADPLQAFQSGDRLQGLKKALAERILNAEMDHHLDTDEEVANGNHRNGHSRKQVITDDGKLDLAIPRGRHGRYDPKLIEKYCRRLPGFDDKVISMYARGMSTREVQGHVGELYGVEVSPELISKVTDAVLDELKEWQSRALDSVYAIVYFDAVRVKVRDEGLVKNKAVYLAIGYTCSGYKQILGMWVEHNEGAKFWLSVMNDLKARGLEDILIAVVDGLSGFPEAIEAAYPAATVQTCIVHLLRNSMAHGSWKERKAIAAELRVIYQADNAEAAEAALGTFEAGDWARSTLASRGAGAAIGSRSSPSSPSPVRSAVRSIPPTPSRA